VRNLYEVNFINNAHQFYLKVYFILGSISLQSIYVAPCFLTTASQRFGRCTIPFRVPLFSVLGWLG